MRRALIVVLLVVVGAGCGGGTAECEAFTTEVADFPATQAVEAPDDPFNGVSQWYAASPEGGLWITSISPSTDDGGGTVLPLNEQARSESDLGVDVPASAPAFGDADADADAAQAALDCAAA
jgi:hypothetical protein